MQMNINSIKNEKMFIKILFSFIFICFCCCCCCLAFVSCLPAACIVFFDQIIIVIKNKKTFTHNLTLALCEAALSESLSLNLMLLLLG